MLFSERFTPFSIVECIRSDKPYNDIIMHTHRQHMYQCHYVYSYCQQIISTSGISNSSVSLCLLTVTPCLSQNVHLPPTYLFISLRMYTQGHPMPYQNVHLPPTYLFISLRMYTQGHPMPSQNVHLPLPIYQSQNVYSRSPNAISECTLTAYLSIDQSQNVYSRSPNAISECTLTAYLSIDQSQNVY